MFQNQKHNTTFLLLYAGIILCLFFSNPAKAQTEDYSFEHLSIDDGLSQNLIFCIVQDSRGFMWFGTQDGLNRYDGYNFKIFHYEPGDSLSLLSNVVHSVFEDSKDNLWVGAGGLNLYDRKMDQFRQIITPELIGLSNTNIQINDIVEDHNGDIWFYIKSVGLYRLQISEIDQTNKWIGDHAEKLKLVGPYLLPEKISGILIGEEEMNLMINERSIWISVEKKIISINAMENGKYPDPDQFQYNEIQFNFTSEESLFHDLLRDDVGNIWIGTSVGLIKISNPANPDDFHFYPFPKNLFAQQWMAVPRKMSKDKNGKIWMATFDGVVIFNPENETFRNIRMNPENPKSLCFNNVTTVFADKGNIMWLGTAGMGIDRYVGSQKKFSHYLSRSGTNKIYSVYSLVSTSNNDLWFSAMAGKLQHYKISNGVCEQMAPPTRTDEWAINDIKSDSKGNIWITNDHLLAWINPPDNKVKAQTLVTRPFGTFFPSDSVFSIYVDKKDSIWLCNTGSLNRIDPLSGWLIRYTLPDLNLTKVNSFLQDKQGTFWIGTRKGLLRYNINNGKWHLFSAAPDFSDSLKNDIITSILEDPVSPEQYMWIGTGGGGLHKMDIQHETFKSFTSEDGLPNNYIYGILADNSGKLWMSTNYGLSCFDPKTSTFKNYNVSDGLQSNEFNSNSYFKSSSGEMFFGGINGITAFYPEQIMPNPNVPSVVITDFLLSYESVDNRTKKSPLKCTISETKVISLNHKQNTLAFEFAAMDFSSPGNNQFRYKLEGFDRSWINVGNKHSATYTNLPSGKFIFRVQGSNNDGVFNETGTSVQIEIAPHPLKTWIAYLFYLIIAGLAGYAVIRYFDEKRRLRREAFEQEVEAKRLAELEKSKSQFFANISHEFRTPITLIQGRVDELLKEMKRFDLREKVISIDQNAGQLLRLIEQLLDIARMESNTMKLNLKAGDLVSFMKKMVNSLQPIAVSRKINLTFKSEHKKLFVEFDHEAMQKIAANLISNALKFTKANGTVEVRLSMFKPTDISRSNNQKDIVQIGVTDNGIGIPESELKFIFNRYYQVDNKDRDDSGFGLGLALVKELTKLSGGNISVKSQINKGSTFTVEIPMQTVNNIEEVKTNTESHLPLIKYEEPKPGNNNQKAAGSQNLHSKLILIVEDNQELREYIKEILQPEYRVILAENGKKGLQIALKELPDFVVSDVKMPEMDGFELIHKLMSDQRTSHIPVILLTAMGQMEDRIHGLNLGADDYLVKPFKNEELLARIKNILTKRELLIKKNTNILMGTDDFDDLNNADQKFLKKVRSIIEENLEDENFGVEVLAGKVGMSSSNLYRKIQALMEMTPVQLVQLIRFNKATNLLKNGYNVSEVSYMVGFRNQSHFSSVFKKRFGVSPSDYAQGK